MKKVARPFASVDHMINKTNPLRTRILGMAGLYYIGERDYKTMKVACPL
jgi:hypothetical protein